MGKKEKLVNRTELSDQSQSLQVEKHLQESIAFLKIANRHTEMTPLLNEFIFEVQKITGCEAVGIRILDQHGNIPYKAYTGFSKLFYEQENLLSLECDHCMCINVVKGATDSNLPCYTSGGSFHVDGTTRFLSTIKDEEKGKTRNACNRFGYESVALIPMRLDKRNLGLIHLADSRESIIPKEIVEQFELISQQLAAAIQRITSESLLRESEERLRRVGDNLPDGVVYRLVHTPDGRRFCTYMSQGSERLFQIKAEDIKKDAGLVYSLFLPEDMEYIAQKEKESIEKKDVFNIETQMLLPNNELRWFQWHSKPTRLDDGSFIWDGVCLDITHRKQAEEKILQSRDNLKFEVQKQTRDLVAANKKLKHEINIRKQKEGELQKAFEDIKKLQQQLEKDHDYLREEIKLSHDYNNIIGESEVLKYILYNIEQIAPTDTTVLILGESGTGKELIARAIHQGSKRNERPLIKVDCAALPTSLIESELFGHEKGSFTSATEKRTGRFELADGATIFLDEIGELPLELQQKMLRIIQDGEYERLGSSQVMHTDVRIIAATNRNLEEDIQKRKFRKDLWYRLNIFPVSIPPLRERAEDIPLLVNWIVKKAERRLGKHIKTIPKSIMNELKAYSWPGNIRELENVIERAVVLAKDNTLRLTSSLKTTAPIDKTKQSSEPMKTLSEMEKDYILEALQATNWNVTGKNGAAHMLGINPSTLRGRMRKHGIHRTPIKS